MGNFTDEYLRQVGGTLHQRRSYKNPKNAYNPLIVSGTITGCGLAQIYGVSGISEKDLSDLLPKIILDYKTDGAGCIIATLGETFYNEEQKLLNCGFQLVKEYQNYRHGENYKQRLYCLTY